MAQQLAVQVHCLARLHDQWPVFLERRHETLKQQDRYGVASEKVAENILTDLFTVALDWTRADLNYQVGYADILLTRLGIKYLVIEVKRPGALAWNRRTVEVALDQVMRYASEQKVNCVAVSDGTMLYAADIRHGGLQDRVFANLDQAESPQSLWWLSVHGIYRQRDDVADAALRLLPEVAPQASTVDQMIDGGLQHPKYGLPLRCFAYVPDCSDPRTWKLPYRLADGRIDVSRLPKAIQAILSNYRGAKVTSIPEADIPDVLVRLALGATSLGRMPHQAADTAPIYQQLAEALDQLGCLDEVVTGSPPK